MINQVYENFKKSSSTILCIYLNSITYFKISPDIKILLIWLSFSTKIEILRGL